MTLDEWLRLRGVNIYKYLGQPVTDLRKDEKSDEIMTFLRTAPNEGLQEWLYLQSKTNRGEPPTPENNYAGWGDIGRQQLERLPPVQNSGQLTKEQLFAIGDRPGFDMAKFLRNVAPGILPRETGQIIADGYKKAGDDPYKRDEWRAAVQDLGSVWSGTKWMKQLHSDLVGIDSPMTAVLYWSDPSNFNDTETKALVNEAMEDPKRGIGSQIMPVARGRINGMKQRGEPVPDWAPDVMAWYALNGRQMGEWQSEVNNTEETAKNFGDAYARGFKNMEAKRHPQQWTGDNMMSGLKVLAQVFNGAGAEHFMRSHMTPDEVSKIGNRMIPEDLEKLAPARVNIYDHYLSNLDGGAGPGPDLSPTEMQRFILMNSTDHQQVDRVIRNSRYPLAALQSYAKTSRHFTDAPKEALEYLREFSKKQKFEDTDYGVLENLGAAFASRGMHQSMAAMAEDAGENREILSGAFAPEMLERLDSNDPLYDKERAATNSLWQHAYDHSPRDWVSDVDRHFSELSGEKFAHLDPQVFARSIRHMGCDTPERLLDGLPDEHLHALHRQVSEIRRHLHGDSYNNMQDAVANEVEERKPAAPLTFTPNSNRLRLIREHLEKQPDRRAPKKTLEQMGHNVQSLGLNPLLDAKGNLTHEALDRHIKSLPQRTLEYKTTTWGDVDRAPHSVNEQRHSDEASRVFTVALPKDVASELYEKDHNAFRHFQHNANQSAEGGHPTLPERGIGWVRYTEGPDGIHIDEIQSDFGQNIRARAQGKYDQKNLADFERSYQQVWQGQKPNEVLHEAFLEHLRQQGRTGQAVHLWDVKPKMELAGQKMQKDPPVHMRDTYKNMPAKAGYTPSTYGKIQTQNHPDIQGEPTWEQKLAKFELSLDTWSADRLVKGWRTKLLGAVAAGGLALAGQEPATQPETESQGNLVDAPVAGATGANQQTLAAKLPKQSVKWTPTGLSEEMFPIAHLESSFGKNVNHAKHPNGDFQTAFGALGLKPQTAHFEYMKRPSLRALHPGLEDQQRFTEELKNNPRFYNQVAGAHFAWLKSALGGDPAKAAYGWRWGIGAAQQALPEQIDADPYVQRYKEMREQALQAKMTAMFDAALKKSVLPTTPVRIHDGKLQTMVGADWEDVAEKSKDGAWNLLGSNHTRASKLLARCLLDGEEIDG